MTPTRDLDALDHIQRLPVGSGRPGWTVTIEAGKENYSCHFPDRGDAPDALRNAIVWRDGEVNRLSAQRGQLLGSSGLGIRVTTSSTNGIEYLVVQAELPATGSRKKERITRSIAKHGLEGAVSQAAQFRFDGMRERYGDEYPFESAEDLAQAVLQRQADES